MAIPKPAVGLVLSVDMILGPAGELEGMHTAIVSLGLKLPDSTATRIAGRVQKVLESELFESEGPAIVRGTHA